MCVFSPLWVPAIITFSLHFETKALTFSFLGFSYLLFSFFFSSLFFSSLSFPFLFFLSSLPADVDGVSEGLIRQGGDVSPTDPAGLVLAQVPPC